MQILDVTKIEPKYKHPTIFDKFDSLTGGEAFVIHNDHDPIPLYYQMLHERGKTFEWEYLERGPEIYKVKITKFKAEEGSETVGELVAEDIRKAEVFRKFGLDFCCGGDKTVKEACEEVGADFSQVQNALTQIDKQGKTRGQNYNEWELDFLSDYIQNTHHNYLKDAFPLLDEISVKVAQVHGQNHTELIRIAELYRAVADELLGHLPKEEDNLFPYIKELVRVKKSSSILKKPDSGSIKNMIDVMQEEHVSVGDSIKEIRKLSKDFQVPPDGCTSYKLLFSKLEEFEADLFEHIHLENNILFPKTIELEKELLI